MKIHGPNRSGSLRPTRDGTVVLCSNCRCEMRLCGIEWETESRDLYKFQCEACERFDVKAVQVH
jgi:hypothetical protein